LKISSVFHIEQKIASEHAAPDGRDRWLVREAVHIEYVELAKIGWKKKSPGLGVQARGCGGTCEDLGVLVIPAAQNQRGAKREMDGQDNDGVSHVRQPGAKSETLNSGPNRQRARDGIHTKLLRYSFDFPASGPETACFPFS